MSAPLPMTVIAGYLGAGKTTLINRILAGDHGLRLLVMVNDFGAINIDAHLLAARDRDTIALTNGCVCCTMGADLFMAIGDVLDRHPRPDHLIIEASGVADPAQIANAAIAEPDLHYGGIVTVVDGPALGGLSADPQIGPQVRHQIARADLICLSKGAATAPLSDLTDAPVLRDVPADVLVSLVADPPGALPAQPHPAYVAWSSDLNPGLDPAALRLAFEARPRGLFRLKGVVRDPSGTGWTVHCVGAQVALSKAPPEAPSMVVGIGLADRVDHTEIEAWWARLQATPAAAP